jgi:phosphoserine aminotransferase
MAMWSMLGARPVDMLAWESFGAGWVTDAVKQLKLDAEVTSALWRDRRSGAVDFDTTWCSPGTAPPRACACPNGDWIPADRAG